MELIELAKRCEAGAGPDRELDADIWMAVTPGHSRVSRTVKSDKGLWPDYVIDETRDESGKLIIVPFYTESLDAALTLVPPHHLFEVKQAIQARAIVWNLESDYDDRGAPTGYSTTFPALALCSAALQARAAVLARHHQGKAGR